MNEPLSDATREEIRKLQGTWRQTGCTADGVVDPPDECGPGPICTFIDRGFVVTRADGVVVIEGTFSIDPAQEPKAIDYTDTFGQDAGKTFPAIYRLDGDTLTFCAADAHMQRPTAFDARVVGHTLRIHQRVAA